MRDENASISLSGDSATSLGPALTLVEALPSPADYNRLRQAVGWGGYLEAEIATSLPLSLYGVCAYSYGNLVGMARVIGDGGLVFYIQDVIVLPDYQSRGIGRLMMDKVMAYVHGHAHHNSVIGLMAAKDKESFYERYGFVARPTERLGHGMTLFWRAG